MPQMCTPAVSGNDSGFVHAAANIACREFLGRRAPCPHRRSLALDQRAEARKLFKQLLINSYCNFLRAWRQALQTEKPLHLHLHVCVHRTWLEGKVHREVGVGGVSSALHVCVCVSVRTHPLYMCVCVCVNLLAHMRALVQRKAHWWGAWSGVRGTRTPRKFPWHSATIKCPAPQTIRSGWPATIQDNRAGELRQNQ